MAEHPPVRLDRRGSTAVLTLDRPQRLNGLDGEISQALAETIEALVGDETVRVVVLTGAGRAFCAGGDMVAAGRALAAGAPQSLFDEVLAFLHRAVLALRALPQPAIAAINGPVSGAGLSLAAACDLRIAASSAVFKAGYTTIGLSPDAGWTALVPALVGASRAAELILLDRPIDAVRALEIGLVHEVCPDESLLDRAATVAAELERQPAASLATAKRLLNASVLPVLEVQLEAERRAVVELAAGPDFRERLGAFLRR